MVPAPTIFEQTTFVTYQPSMEDKGGQYHLTLILKDSKDHEYVFTSRVVYAHDESGKAHFDLSTVKTADFNYR